MTDLLDCVVVGGGPAGLQAALTLARSRRTVCVVDAGHPRNEASHALRGFITRDGILPGELLRLAWRELEAYPEASRRSGAVTSARRLRGAFEVSGEGFRLRSRKLILATGVADELPDVPGLRELYGSHVFHCPYCDGYEHAGRPLLLLAEGRRAHAAATFLLNWSPTVDVLLHGGEPPPKRRQAELREAGVRLFPGRVLRLDPQPRGLAATLESGERISASALFFSRPSFGKSALAEQLGAGVDREGAIRVRARGKTSVPGLYAAGNVLRDVMLSIVAAGQGCEAAFEVVRELAAEDRANKTHR